MRLILVSILSVFSFYNAFGQDNQQKPDTILYNNGRVLAARVIDTSSDKITIEKPNSSNHKKIEVDRNAVFSIKYSTGKEALIYTYDTLIGNDFTIPDARLFIAGEQDAQKGYHPRIPTIGAFLIGAASGLTGVSFFVFGPPFLYSGLMAVPRIKISHKSVKNLNYVKSDPYLYGYDSVGRRKRVLRSFIWSGIGLALGFTYHFVGNLNK